MSTDICARSRREPRLTTELPRVDGFIVGSCPCVRTTRITLHRTGGKEKKVNLTAAKRLHCAHIGQCHPASYVDAVQLLSGGRSVECRISRVVQHWRGSFTAGISLSISRSRHGQLARNVPVLLSVDSCRHADMETFGSLFVLCCQRTGQRNQEHPAF